MLRKLALAIAVAAPVALLAATGGTPVAAQGRTAAVTSACRGRSTSRTWHSNPALSSLAGPPPPT